MSVGTSMANQYAWKINQFGSTLTLPSGAHTKAIEVKEDRIAAKYLRVDDINAPEKLKVVIELKAADFTGHVVAVGMVVTWETSKYIIEGPLHPETLQDVCTRLFIVLSKN